MAPGHASNEIQMKVMKLYLKIKILHSHQHKLKQFQTCLGKVMLKLEAEEMSERCSCLCSSTELQQLSLICLTCLHEVLCHKLQSPTAWLFQNCQSKVMKQKDSLSLSLCVCVCVFKNPSLRTLIKKFLLKHKTTDYFPTKQDKSILRSSQSEFTQEFIKVVGVFF